MHSHSGYTLPPFPPLAPECAPVSPPLAPECAPMSPPLAPECAPMSGSVQSTEGNDGQCHYGASASGDTQVCAWLRCLGVLGRFSPPSNFWGSWTRSPFRKGTAWQESQILVYVTLSPQKTLCYRTWNYTFTCLAVLIHYLHDYSSNF